MFIVNGMGGASALPMVFLMTCSQHAFFIIVACFPFCDSR